MARPGETIQNPKTGEHITFRETADDSGGERLRFEYVLESGGEPIAPHKHPEQREIIEVRSGTLSARIDGEEGTVPAGQTLRIPPDTPHHVWNEGLDPVRTVVDIEPALRMEEFFETTFGLARDGKTDPEGHPSTLQLAVLADEFSEELRFPMVPNWLGRPARTVLAAVGRAAGYQGTYAEYTSEPVEVTSPR